MIFISQFLPQQSETGISRQSFLMAQYFEKIGIETTLFTWERQIIHPFQKNGKVIYPLNMLAQQAKTDAFLLFYGEHWSVPKGIETLNIPLLWYIPVDSPKLPNDFAESAAVFDLIIPVTEFAANVMREAEIQNVWNPIPHTVLLKDTKETLDIKVDKLIIGTVLRPQRRKNVVGLAQCIAEIDCQLLVVSEEEYKEVALKDIFDQFNLNYEILGDLDATNMRRFYNTIDLYVSTTEAEGFGIPVFEAIFTEKCVLVTDLQVFREFGLQNTNLIKVKKTFDLPNGANWNLIDEKDFLQKYKILKDKNFPKTNVDIAQFAPEIVGPQWKALLENLRTILAYQ